jgi:hypothetical protein
VINPAHIVGRVQALPRVRFVGLYDRAGGDVFAYQRHCLALARHNERPGAAHHFTGDNYDLALASLFLRKPSPNPAEWSVSRALKPEVGKERER